MTIVANDSITLLNHLYEESKFWSALVALIWAVFRGFNWLRDREKDLKVIQGDMGLLNGEVKKQTGAIEFGFERQTSSLTRELQELRSDFRTFYTAPDPLMIPVRARATRKRASVAARVEAKAQVPAKRKPKAAK